MKTTYVNRWKTTIWNMKFAKVNSTKRLIQHEPISCITKVTEDMEIIKKTYCQNKTKIQAMENTWNTLWRRKTGCTKVIKQVFKLKKMIRKIQQSTMSSKVTQRSLMKLNSYQSKSRFEHFSSTSLLGEELPTNARSNDLEDTNYHRVTFGSSRPICDGRRRCRRRARLFKLSFPSSAPNLWEGHCP